MLALVEFTGNKDSNYWETNTRENVTVQYLHSYESKSIENRLRRWDFDLYASGFWYFYAKTPRGIVDC